MLKKNIIFIIVIITFATAFGLTYFFADLSEKKVRLPEETLQQAKTEKEISVSEAFEFLPIEPVDWTNPDKPMESLPVTEQEIPEQAIRLGIAKSGFQPAVFEATAGQKIILAVSCLDNSVHIFKFENPQLSEVAVGVANHETRLVTFYTPKEPGEYLFYCDVPGHKSQGERGKMIVK